MKEFTIVYVPTSLISKGKKIKKGIAVFYFNHRGTE